jgi:hypothetical protein
MLLSFKSARVTTGGGIEIISPLSFITPLLVTPSSLAMGGFTGSFGVSAHACNKKGSIPIIKAFTILLFG